MRLTAFFKLYKSCILLHRCNLKIFAKNRFEKTAIFVKFQQKNANVAKFAKFAKFQKIQLENLVGGRHLPIVSYGHSYKQTYSDTSFPESTVFAHLDRIVSLHILSGRLSSNSCSAVISRVLCYAMNSLFCFRPFPEVTLLARRR